MARISVFVLVLLLTFSAVAEEIPIETCGRLPVVRVKVSGSEYLFLVDTAATSMLSLQSFFHGDRLAIAVTSWSGTVKTDAQEVVIADLAIGQRHLKNLKLHAVDLSPIGRSCGRIISGILGIDLLERLGATVDLKDHAARLLLEPENAPARIAELQTQLLACEQAFNRADETAFADCLDKQVVVFTLDVDYYGRKAVLEYLRGRYFQQHPSAQLQMVARAHHVLGEAIWTEYDVRIVLGQQLIQIRGTALCQREEGKWRIMRMYNTSGK